MENPVENLRSTGDAPGDAKRALNALWNLGSDTPPLPVDPIFMAQQLGIEVLTVQLQDERLAGMLVKEPWKNPVIYLSKADTRRRQRFTCAHELGHWMQRQNGREDWAFVDKRDDLARAGTNPVERYANNFAASLLMPEELVRRLRGVLGTNEMADKFEVSQSAMSFRLTNLG